MKLIKCQVIKYNKMNKMNKMVSSQKVNQEINRKTKNLKFQRTQRKNIMNQRRMRMPLNTKVKRPKRNLRNRKINNRLSLKNLGKVLILKIVIKTLIKNKRFFIHQVFFMHMNNSLVIYQRNKNFLFRIVKFIVFMNQLPKKFQNKKKK